MGIASKVPLRDLPAHLLRMGESAVRVDLNRVWKQVGVALENGAKDCFNDSRSPDGQPWSPLRHPRPRGGTKPLLDRGILRASIVSKGKGHIEEACGNSLEWGTNQAYAALQNHGGVITPKKGKFLAIPASVEALRAGGPRSFPNAKARLRWKIGTKGGIVYETLGKKWKKGPGGAGAAKRPGRKGAGRFGKTVKRIKSRWKKTSKRLRRFGSRGLKLLRSSLKRIGSLTKKIVSMQKRLRSFKPSSKAAMNLVKSLFKAKAQLKAAKQRHRQLRQKLSRIARGKNVKPARTGPNKVLRFIDGQQAVIHYFLTKRVEVPARPFMGISKATEEVISQIFADEAIRAFIAA